MSVLHSVGVIHTDVQPSNVMLRWADCAREVSEEGIRGKEIGVDTCSKGTMDAVELVLVDLASSTAVDRPCYSMIGTKSYRPPEVTMGE